MNRRGFLATMMIAVGGFQFVNRAIATDDLLVCIYYQTGYCNSVNFESYTTRETRFDEIARQALKKRERAYAIELRNNDGAIHYWTLAHEDNAHLGQMTRNSYKLFKWYERKIPNGITRLTTFNV
jgi:hypothetical protein